MDKLIDYYYANNITCPNNKRDRDFMKINWVQFVYVIYNPCNNLTKIGFTTDIGSRYNSLRSQTGCELEIKLIIQLGYYDDNAKYIESKLHSYYSKKRKIGEWFNLTNKDIKEIENLFYDLDTEDVQVDGYFECTTTEEMIMDAILNN